ncbi:MAG: hypothetical protein Ct9H300mP1_23720 [Planctomycetaceae bacterium]|nr:MAG: hypothetical protein Ct9H300mP1_23720 [Planctomycetaceae bacterium]
MILTEVNMSQDVRQGRGRITVTGLANDRGPVTKMTSDIRGLENYTVRPSKLDPNKDRQATFKFRFKKVNILLDGKAKTPGAEKTKTENGQTQTKADPSDKEEPGIMKKSEKLLVGGLVLVVVGWLFGSSLLGLVIGSSAQLEARKSP